MVLGFKVNIQKSILPLYNSNKQLEIDILESSIYNSIDDCEILNDNSGESIYNIRTLKTM